MHSSLVVTTDCVPLGLAAVTFWTRQPFKGPNALTRRVNPTHVLEEMRGNQLQAARRLGISGTPCVGDSLSWGFTSLAGSSRK
jgi:hypothetical protein